jgi:hypothetical protein
MLPVIRVDMGDLTQDYVVGRNLEVKVSFRGIVKNVRRAYESHAKDITFAQTTALDRVMDDIVMLYKDSHFSVMSRTGALRASLNVLMGHIKEVLELFSADATALKLDAFDVSSNEIMMYTDENVSKIKEHMKEIYDFIQGLKSFRNAPAFVIALSIMYNQLATAAQAGIPAKRNPSQPVSMQSTHYPVLLRLP